MSANTDRSGSPGNGTGSAALNLPPALPEPTRQRPAGTREPMASAPSGGGLRGAGPGRVPAPRPRWELRYAQAVAATDLLAMAGSLGLREWWGQAPPMPHLPAALALILLGLTAAALVLARAWDPRILGQGTEEFSRLLRALVAVAVVLGLAGLALKLSEVRPWVFGVVPVAGGLAAAGRLLLRTALHRHRRTGRCIHQVLAVGTEEAVAELIVRARRASHHGWAVTAACTPSGTGTGGGATILDVPVVGDLDSVAEVARQGRHRVVSIAQAPGWTSRRLHHLAWDLEGTGTELVVDPGLMEIAGPRLHVAAMDGLPLLRLTEPAFTGVPRVLKEVGDRLVAGVLLGLLAPVLLGVAIAIRSDGGPVCHRQVRVGRGGERFVMIRFRSVPAEVARRPGASTSVPVPGSVPGSVPGPTHAHQDPGAGGLPPGLPPRGDPRVTRVGALLHRYSLDELPQLVNVLTGSMSLVGPRPPVPDEVAGYARDAQRKLLVKPGLTGLWQISGRRDLSWEESVRLDLRYVENWSLALDFLIIWKTIGAVLKGTRTY